MSATNPDAWLRGPVPGVPDPLMPAAHTLLQVRVETGRLARDLPPGEMVTAVRVVRGLRESGRGEGASWRS